MRTGETDPSPESTLKREEGTVIWREPGPGEESVIVKLYRRRGWWTVLRERLTRFRTQREYLRLLHLALWAVPCTEPLDWSRGYSERHGNYEVLVTRELPGARPLSAMAAAGSPLPDLSPLFRTVRRMHESGVVSQTLYPSNVLVRSEPAGEDRFFLSDLPRSWIFPRSVVGTRLAWYDVLDLVCGLEELGFVLPPDALEAYGFDESGRRWWARHRHLRAWSKARRLARDAEARGRWVLAWSAFWRPRTRPPGPPADASPDRGSSPAR